MPAFSAPPSGRRLALVVAALAWAGCATAPVAGPSPESPAAQLRVTNLSERGWRLTARPAESGAARVVRVPARGAIVWSLPAGTYAIEQAMLTEDNSVAATRTFPLRVTAGESYQWPLATLQSAAASAPGRDSPP